MRLLLDPLDLKPEYRKGGDQAISTFQVSFDKLTAKAQVAVGAVGSATFYSWDHATHQLIAPPEEVRNGTE